MKYFLITLIILISFFGLFQIQKAQSALSYYAYVLFRHPYNDANGDRCTDEYNGLKVCDISIDHPYRGTGEITYTAGYPSGFPAFGIGYPSLGYFPTDSYFTCVAAGTGTRVIGTQNTSGGKICNSIFDNNNPGSGDDEFTIYYNGGAKPGDVFLVGLTCTTGSNCKYGTDSLFYLRIYAPPCSINSFTADTSTVAYNSSTNLRFTLSGAFPWTISTLSGPGSASPSSGNSSGGVSSTGALTDTTTYRLSCGSATRDVTVFVPPAPVCSPGSQSVDVGQAASLTASQGDGNYSWSAPSGNPSSGSGSSFNVSYSTSGDKTVTVNSAGRSASCTVNIPSLTCGNGQIDSGEQCDGSNLNGQTCTSLGFAGGTLSCYSNCTFNTSSCTSSSIESITATKLSCSGGYGTYRIHVVSTVYNFYIRVNGSTVMTSMNEPVTTSAGRDYDTGNWVTDNMLFELVKATDNSVMKSVNVGITGCSGNSPGCTLTASPSSGTAPLSGTLSWSTTNNPTSCIASDGWSGSKNVNGGSENYGPIYTTTKYSLTCSNTFGSGTCSATVSIGTSPTPTSPTPTSPTSTSPPPTLPTSLSCSPFVQNVSIGQPATLSATGGTGSYSWSAPGGNPSSGYGSSFSTTYSTTGTKGVTVSSGTRSSSCVVSVGSGGTPSNLTVTDFHLTDSNGNTKTTFARGERIYPSVTIKNIGTAPTTSSQGFFYISIYSNKPWAVSTYTSSDVGVWVTDYSSIAPGQSKTYSITQNTSLWSATNWTMANTGSYTARAFVDSFDYVAETNETDNQAISSYTIGAANQPPTVSNVTIIEPDYCTSGPAAYVNWTYSDPEGDPQSAYQVQVDDIGSAWNPPYVFDCLCQNGTFSGSACPLSGACDGSSTSIFVNGLNFNTTYKARVKVWDTP